MRNSRIASSTRPSGKRRNITIMFAPQDVPRGELDRAPEAAFRQLPLGLARLHHPKPSCASADRGSN